MPVRRSDFGATASRDAAVLASPPSGIVMFVVFCALVLRFFSRVLYNLRETQAEIHLNPFL